MGNHININLSIYAAELGILKPYSVYVKVKSIYRHSIIYNYTPNKLSRVTKLHHKTIKRYVDKLIKYKFCELRNGHLLFKAPRKMYRNLRL